MSNIDLLVGAPVCRRAWVLPHWFNYVEWALRRVAEVTGQGFTREYVFVGDPKSDPDTFSMIRAQGPFSTVIEVDEDESAGQRNWGVTERKVHMVELRNMLLTHVRKVSPELFLSLDTDILIHPDAIMSMIGLMGDTRWDAVGGKCYMTPLPQGPAPTNPNVGTACPSFLLQGRAGMFRRRDPETAAAFEVDVIMAIKLMTPVAYHIDYEYHSHGEDVGWSLAAKKKGLRLGWDGRVCSKHTMHPDHLHVLDSRCGY